MSKFRLTSDGFTISSLLPHDVTMMTNIIITRIASEIYAQSQSAFVQTITMAQFIYTIYI